MGNLVFQATLGGQVNLVGPNTASTFNLNVPAVSSTIASLAAQTFAGTQTFSVDSVVNGLTVGRGAGAVSTNTAVGASALSANTTGGNSTAVGYQSLYSQVGGSNLNNTTAGYQAGYSITSGTNNTAVGYIAGKAITTGNYNVSVGRLSMDNSAGVTGDENTAIGNGTMRVLTSGANNTGVGSGALASNTTASSNTAVGYQAGYSNTTASSNTAVGYQAGYTNTVGTENTFIGYQAGYTSSAASTGRNTFVGYMAGNVVTTGTDNTFIGRNSGVAMTTGNNNVIIGRYTGNQGGLDIRTSSNYIVLSDGDGNPRGVFDASGNFLVNSASFASLDQNAFLIGSPSGRFLAQHATGTSSGTAYATFQYAGTGIGSITQAGTTGVLYNVTSDYRLKNVIGAVTGSGERIDALEPIEYQWKSDGSNTRGFLAHKFQEVYPQSVSGEKDAVDENGDPKYQNMQAGTSEVIADLVSEIQSLRQRVAQLESN